VYGLAGVVETLLAFAANSNWRCTSTQNLFRLGSPGFGKNAFSSDLDGTSSVMLFAIHRSCWTYILQGPLFGFGEEEINGREDDDDVHRGKEGIGAPSNGCKHRTSDPHY
jgi:hypothetical protein